MANKGSDIARSSLNAMLDSSKAPCEITEARIGNANYFDKHFSAIPQITVPVRLPNTRQVFHIYVIRAEKRNELQRFLVDQGVDAKIHYPVPIHLQPAARHLGYKRGDLPVTESQAEKILTLPIHQYLSEGQISYVSESINKFYEK